ncbi:hypothetical protein [Staphylococcus haemolyticus]|uniref:hypothetical protein n=1 Tax=Staphylococcus haemolyticus TaxID=1283 RepID=UPI0015D818A3|nr:hypothetical protein [Staphylococcus haemolyticus]
MNLNQLEKAFNEIFDEIEQMDEEKIKKIDFEIEKNITKYRKSLLKYNNEFSNVMIDTTCEDIEYINELKKSFYQNNNEFSKNNYYKKAIEGMSTSAA